MALTPEGKHEFLKKRYFILCGIIFCVAVGFVSGIAFAKYILRFDIGAGGRFNSENMGQLVGGQQASAISTENWKVYNPPENDFPMRLKHPPEWGHEERRYNTITFGGAVELMKSGKATLEETMAKWLGKGFGLAGDFRTDWIIGKKLGRTTPAGSSEIYLFQDHSFEFPYPTYAFGVFDIQETSREMQAFRQMVFEIAFVGGDGKPFALSQSVRKFRVCRDSIIV